MIFLQGDKDLGACLPIANNLIGKPKEMRPTAARLEEAEWKSAEA